MPIVLHLVQHRSVKLWLACSVWLVMWLSNAGSAQAQAVLFQDNFDDPDISDWTVQRNQQWNNANQPCLNSGQPAEWQVVNGELGITISGGPSCTTEITPDNLDLSQVAAFKFSFDWNFQESINMDRNVLFLWQDARNWYDIKTIGTQLLIQKVVDGRGYVVPNGLAYYPFVANTTYHFEIAVIDHELVIQINGQEVLRTVDDPPYITGFRTIGLQASTGAITRSVSYFDNLVVEELPEPGSVKLAVPPLRQDEPAWGEIEYDHATIWSDQPTMARWGCALTAMVMVLQYHGVSSLPSGIPIDPASLNNWLIGQPDGYIGEGLVNWLAVTRMARQSAELFGSTKLEFAAVTEDLFTRAQQEITQNRPVIVQLPGHFVVGDGLNPGGTDLLITDPYFPLTKLSQHPAEMLSLRTFLPSQTDLSYVLIVSPIEMEIEVIDGSGNAMTTPTIIEHLQDPVDQTRQTSSVKLTLLPKLQTGSYNIKLTSPSWQKSAISVYSYDQLAEVKQFPLQLTTGPVTGSWQLNFDQADSDQSTLDSISFDLVWYRQLLSELYQRQDILSKYVYLELDETVSSAQQFPYQHPRYVKLLKQKISLYQSYLTESAQTLLAIE